MTKPNRPPFCLQENNAIAVFDLLSASFTAIWPLGWKSWSANLVDVSDMDGVSLNTHVNVVAWCVPCGHSGIFKLTLKLNLKLNSISNSNSKLCSKFMEVTRSA